jgi:hypothetical protein
MSNQTFVKKDRISFAVNLNEVLSIAPTNNNTTIYFGSSNLDSNVGVVLTDTVAIAMFVHPVAASVPVTLYIVVTEGVTA